MKTLLITSLLVICTTAANAKIWRVNNNPGASADFNSTITMEASASVLNGDTVHIEPSATAYSSFSLNKRLIIIGGGYFLSGANGNLGLQVHTEESTVGTIYLDSTGVTQNSSGSKFIGLELPSGIITGSASSGGYNVDNIEIIRCKAYYIYSSGGAAPTDHWNNGWKIKQCYVEGYIDMSPNRCTNWEITNNIFLGQLTIGNTSNINNLIRNNFIRSSIDIYNAYFTNNLILSQSFSFNANLCVVKNNTAMQNITSGGFFPYLSGNGNSHNQSEAVTFQGLTSNTTDGQWRLKAGSLAIGSGETVSGVTPDRGPFGTADPYRLSGIAPIPSIYGFTAPTNVATNATNMNVTISIKSNN